MYKIGDRVVWNGHAAEVISRFGLYATIRLDNGAIGTVRQNELESLA